MAYLCVIHGRTEEQCDCAKWEETVSKVRSILLQEAVKEMDRNIRSVLSGDKNG